MIRVGLIGYGYWGPKLARSIAPETGCELRTICDLSEKRLAIAAADHPAAILEHDGRRLLSDPRVDAVIIATPADSHFDLTMAALATGKHVLVEKPMALSSRDAAAMIAEARHKNLVLLVDHTYIHSPAIEAIREILARGSLGQIREYRSDRWNAEGGRQDADVLWDLAAHDLSILEHLFPAAAQAVRASEMAAGTGTAPSRAALTVHFPDGLTACIHVDWAAGEKQRRIEITGTRGSLVFDDLREPKLRRFGPPGKAEPSTIELEADEPLTRLARHFAACIRGAERTIDDAFRVIRILEAASRSLASSGSLVPLDAECRPYQPRAPKEAGLFCDDAKLDAR